MNPSKRTNFLGPKLSTVTNYFSLYRLSYRPMMQTRLSFATTAFSLGENPLWIAKVMGHSTTRMVIDVYAKYIANQNGTPDGGRLDQAYQ